MRLHQFTLTEFSILKDQWQDLLSRSDDADSLFLSWHWMYNWWEVYSDLNNDELMLIGVFNDNNDLICIAPLYTSVKKIKNIISIKKLNFIGTRIEGSFGFRTEYLQFITDKNASNSVIQKIFYFLSNESNFDELWLNDLMINSSTYKELMKLTNNRAYYKRLQETGYSYGLNVEGGFGDYIGSLGKNTRLKLFNRRKVLTKLGDINIEQVSNSTFKEALNILSEFHVHRWENEISYAKHEIFIGKLISNSNIKICGVIIKLNNVNIGCTFDIVCNGRSYNIQSGYKEDVDKKIAMGLLTIGYAIEIYHQQKDCVYYDFLAGEGKKSNYKARIAEPEIEFESNQIISSTILRLIYQLKDKFSS